MLATPIGGISFLPKQRNYGISIVMTYCVSSLMFLKLSAAFKIEPVYRSGAIISGNRKPGKLFRLVSGKVLKLLWGDYNMK